MIKTAKRNIHWDYYLALESDIKKVARYIEFDESNFDTHSIELSHLLLAASSEVDVVLKELCKRLYPKSSAGKINEYRDVIKKYLPGLIKQDIISPRYGLTLNPWINWEGDESPDWWRNYNKVKHERSDFYKKANLNSVLNSIAGLFIVNIHYNHALVCSKNKDYPYDLKDSINTLRPEANLFRIDDPFLYLHD